MESLNLPLYFPLHSDFDLDELGKDAHDLVGALIDLVVVLALDFAEEASGYFLA